MKNLFIFNKSENLWKKSMYILELISMFTEDETTPTFRKCKPKLTSVLNVLVEVKIKFSFMGMQNIWEI